MTNLLAEDREQALAVMDDDEKFDRWMKNYAAKQGSGKSTIDQDEFINKYAKTYGEG